MFDSSPIIEVSISDTATVVHVLAGEFTHVLPDTTGALTPAADAVTGEISNKTTVSNVGVFATIEMVNTGALGSCAPLSVMFKPVSM